MREKIRNQVKNILLNYANLDVKNIYSNHPSVVGMQELPVCCIYYEEEQLEVIVGSQKEPKVYERTLPVRVTIISTINSDVESWLDKHATKIELAVGYYGIEDAQVVFTSVEPYIISDEQENIAFGTTVSFNVIYESEAWLDKKHDLFTEYNIKIIDEESTTLIGAEGSL